jgi:hypothetical protein
MTNTADERAAKIEALANTIINDAKRRDAERRQRNEAEMEKLKTFLKGKAERWTR